MIFSSLYLYVHIPHLCTGYNAQISVCMALLFWVVKVPLMIKALVEVDFSASKNLHFFMVLNLAKKATFF